MGFLDRGPASGTHQTMVNGANRPVVVPLGKREIARGTLGSIIRQAGFDEAETKQFLSHIR